MSRLLFGKEIEPLTRACNLVDDPEITYYLHKPKLNLYVMVNNLCQANCKFCTQHGENKPFDFYKFRNVLDELRFQNDKGDMFLSKVNFTGGEPLLDFDKFEKIHKMVFDRFTMDELGNGNVVVNTNGINLDKLYEREDLMKNIGFVSISRHHYDDDVNEEIFNTKALPSTKLITDFNNKYHHRVWLRCNCIKGYIDNEEEILKYCNWGIGVGSKHCGFSSLMELNDYCKDNYVYVNVHEMPNLSIRLNSYRYNEDNKLVCNCNRLLYINDNDDWIDIYTWNRNLEAKAGPEGVLVFDGEYLRYGFFGEIIC